MKSNFFDKLKHTCKNLWIGLFIGLKKTDDDFFTSVNVNEGEGAGINQQVRDNRVSRALLRGELTQEVKELRYRTYTIDREAKNYDMYSPFLAIRRESQDSKHVQYENLDNHKLLVIQPNHHKVDGTNDVIKDIDLSKVKYNSKGEMEYNLGSFKETHHYMITVSREEGFRPRHLIEEYTTRVVCFKDDDSAYIDFYVSKYHDQFDRSARAFVSEVSRVKESGVRSDIVSINGLSFVTRHAFNDVDMIRFVFDGLRFMNITEYDGHYVIHFKGNLVERKDITEEYYDEKMDQKYKNHEKKETCINYDGTADIRTYVCAECGKVVTYDASKIDDSDPTPGRDIDEAPKDYHESTATDFMDVEISEETFGVRLCKECMEKKMEELYLRNMKSFKKE